MVVMGTRLTVTRVILRLRTEARTTQTVESGQESRCVLSRGSAAAPLQPGGAPARPVTVLLLQNGARTSGLQLLGPV